MKIIFLRHGLTESNKELKFSTPKTKLSKKLILIWIKAKKI